MRFSTGFGFGGEGWGSALVEAGGDGCWRVCCGEDHVPFLHDLRDEVAVHVQRDSPGPVCALVLRSG
jgi:hypothetical protein